MPLFLGNRPDQNRVRGSTHQYGIELSKRSAAHLRLPPGLVCETVLRELPARLLNAALGWLATGFGTRTVWHA